MSEYRNLNIGHKGPLVDPCTEFTAQQAYGLCALKEGSKVLDYGCSIGRAAQVFKSKGCLVYGVDVVPENLAKAASFCEETYLRKEQSDPLPFNQGYFDLVFSAQVIEHLYRRDGYAFFAEAFALLAGGGQIFLTTPNPHYIRVLAKRLPMIRSSHLSSWIIEEMMISLRKVGFEHVYWRGNGRMATLIGDGLPCRWVYGGYAMIATKPSL